MVGRGWIGAAFAAIGVALLAAGCAPEVKHEAPIPKGYPDDYGETIAAAEKEGVLVVWSTTDDATVHEVIDGFRRRYPRIKLVYAEKSALHIYNDFLDQLAHNNLTADLLWSSAMDLQIKLVNDGYAQRYASPESANLPRWANWKSEAWGITAEPIVMLYNKRLIDPAAAPKSHTEFRRMLESQSHSLDGKIATYDPARSAVGYLYLSQDDAAGRDIWRMAKALGANHARLFAKTEDIIADVSSGRSLIGYNAVGSYVADEIRRNPDVAVVLPHDYTLIMSRIAMIPQKAPHPNTARVFLDYLLSKAGQTALAKHAMPSVRADVSRPKSLPDAGVTLRAIRVSPGLLILQDKLTRAYFMKRWNRALKEGEAAQPGQLQP